MYNNVKKALFTLVLIATACAGTSALAAQKRDEGDIYFNQFDTEKIGDSRASIVDSGDPEHGNVLKIVPTSSKGYMEKSFNISEGRDYSVSFDFKADQSDHPFKFMFRDFAGTGDQITYHDFAHFSLDSHNNFVVSLHGWSNWGMKGTYDNVSWSSIGEYGTDWNNINIVFHPNNDKTTIDYYINGKLAKTCDTTLGENGETAELKGESGLLRTMYFLTTDTGTAEGASAAVDYDGSEAFYMDNLRVSYVDKENLTADAEYNGNNITVKMSEPFEGDVNADNISIIATASNDEVEAADVRMIGPSYIEITPAEELEVNTEYMVIMPQDVRSKSGKQLFSKRLAFVVSGSASSSDTPVIPQVGDILWDHDYNDLEENLPAAWNSTWSPIIVPDHVKGISTYKMMQSDETEGIVLKYEAVSGATFLRLEQGGGRFTDNAEQEVVVASMDVYRDEMKRTADFLIVSDTGMRLGMWFFDSYGNLVFVTDSANMWSDDDVNHGEGDASYSAKHTVYNQKTETDKWYNITAVISKKSKSIQYFVNGEYVTTAPIGSNWNKVFGGFRVQLNGKGFTDNRAIYADNVKFYYPAAPDSEVKVTNFRLTDRNGGVYGAAEDTAPVDMRTGKIYLSDKINSASVSDAEITLTDEAGTNMLQNFSYNESKKSIEFEVWDLLDKASEYTMNITGLEDMAGNSVPGYSASFTTTPEGELVMTDYGFYKGDAKVTELTGGTFTLKAVYVNTTDDDVTRELAASYLNDYEVKASDRQEYTIESMVRDMELALNINIDSPDKGMLVGALLDEKGMPIENAAAIGSYEYTSNKWSLDFESSTSPETNVYCEIINPESKVKYRGQTKTGADGKFAVNIRLNESDISGYYELKWVDENGTDGKVSKLFANDIECLDVVGDINKAVAEGENESAAVSTIADMLKNKQYALNIGIEGFDKINSQFAAQILYNDIKSNPLDETDSTSGTGIINRAVEIAAVYGGVDDNLFDNADILELDNSRIKDFYKKYYVNEDMQKSITQSLKNGSYNSFESFYKALTEKFVLAAVAAPDGVGNAKEIIQAFSGADEIGTGATGSEAAYRTVMGKKYSSYQELKNVFDAANSSGGGSSGGNGSSSGGGGKTGGAVSQLPVSYDNKNVSEKEIPKDIFSDIDSVSWAKDAIVYLAEKGVINGKNEDKFCPNDMITRQEIAKLAVLAFGLKNDNGISSTFTDVSSWANEYVNCAFANEIVKGYDNTVFGAADFVTRQDLAVMIYRSALAAGYEFDSEGETVFADSDNISDYAVEAINKLCNAGAINGKDNGEFAPHDRASRAEAAKIIYNVIK